MKWAKHTGFTIVELLIVIVVIAILAAITIVAYNGIQDRARQAKVQSDVAQAVKTIEAAKITSGTETYPGTQAAANVKASDGVTLLYGYNATTNSYCVQAADGSAVFSATSSQPTPRAVSCAENGLIGWWRLNGDGVDSSGNGWAATVNGSVINGQGGQANGAYSFNGSSQSGVVQGSSNIFPENSVASVSFWARPTAWSGESASAFISKRSGSSDGIFIMYLTVSGTLAIDCAANRWQTSYVPPLNQWTFFVVMCTPQTISAYVNGVSIGSAQRTVTTLNNSTDLQFGRDRAQYYLTGAMDDIRVYDRLLSTTEAQAMYGVGAQ